MPGAGPTATELATITRRGFNDNCYLQIYQSAPLIAAFLNNAAAASGGVNPINIPVQGVPMVNIANIGFDGSFDLPGQTPGINAAIFNLKGYISVVPFLGMEGLVQLDYSIVPLIDARMNDVGNQYQKQLSTDLYNNITNTSSLIGLNGAIDDGTFLTTYGGLSRTTYPWWKSTYVHNSSPTAPTRDLMLQYILQLTKASMKPNIGMLGVGTWGKLAQDFGSKEVYNIFPKENFGKGTAGSYFTAMEITGMPIYCDPYCPEGTLYLMNSDYLTLYIHDRCGFQFTGFESRMPVGQLGYIGAVVTLIELANARPSAQGKFDNLSYLSI